jgi:hypothetical protein
VPYRNIWVRQLPFSLSGTASGKKRREIRR